MVNIQNQTNSLGIRTGKGNSSVRVWSNVTRGSVASMATESVYCHRWKDGGGHQGSVNHIKRDVKKLKRVEISYGEDIYDATAGLEKCKRTRNRYSKNMEEQERTKEIQS